MALLSFRGIDAPRQLSGLPEDKGAEVVMDPKMRPLIERFEQRGHGRDQTPTLALQQDAKEPDRAEAQSLGDSTSGSFIDQDGIRMHFQCQGNRGPLSGVEGRIGGEIRSHGCRLTDFDEGRKRQGGEAGIRRGKAFKLSAHLGRCQDLPEKRREQRLQPEPGEIEDDGSVGDHDHRASPRVAMSSFNIARVYAGMFRRCSSLSKASRVSPARVAAGPRETRPAA